MASPMESVGVDVLNGCCARDGAGMEFFAAKDIRDRYNERKGVCAKIILMDGR